MVVEKYSGTNTALLRKKTDSFIKNLMAESDRGAALVGLAYLDALLGRLFEAKMLKGTSANRLLNYPGAFSTASARTDAAYSLGWISVETYRDLVTLRKIRNRFAHAHNALTFSDVDVQTQCASLRLPKEALPD